MSQQLKFVANEMFNDYVTGKDLTVFTSLDFENFYETR